jgi:hypothetical protein
MRNWREQQRTMQQARRFRHIIREGRATRHMAKRRIMGEGRALG